MLRDEPGEALREVMETIKSKNSMSNRRLADEMHRQADNLHQKGDYETALILYYRAVNLCPRDINHILSAKKTESQIITTTKTKPPEKTRVYLKTRKFKNDEIPDKIKCNSNGLKFLLEKKTNPGKMNVELDLKLAKIQGSSSSVNNNLETLKWYFGKENWKVCLRIGNELLATSKNINNSVTNITHYHIIIHHYLSLTYMSILRHDYAINHATKMLKKSINLDNHKLILKSIILLSRVHLNFGHYNASIHALNNLLSIYMDEEMIKAWLLNKIGNCYFEMRLYKESLYIAKKFCEFAFTIDSVKWLYHGKLLGGQVLIKLARYNEALELLNHAKKFILIYQNNLKIKLNEFEKSKKNKIKIKSKNNNDKLNFIFNYNQDLLEYVDDLISVVANVIDFNEKEKNYCQNSPSASYQSCDDMMITQDKNGKCNPTATHTSTFTTTNGQGQNRSSSCRVVDKWKNLLIGYK